MRALTRAVTKAVTNKTFSKGFLVEINRPDCCNQMLQTSAGARKGYPKGGQFSSTSKIKM